MKNMKEIVSKKVLNSAHSKAKQTAGMFCRLFLSEPKVPKALLEAEARKS